MGFFIHQDGELTNPSSLTQCKRFILNNCIVKYLKMKQNNHNNIFSQFFKDTHWYM